MIQPAELPQIDLGPIDALQAELLSLTERMTAEPDRDRQQALVKRISEASDELARACAALEAKAKLGARELRGFIEVSLTPDQREAVRLRTGVLLDAVRLSDEGGSLSVAMPLMARSQILALAMAEGEARAREGQAQRAAADELDRVSGELRRDAPEQVRKEIDRLLDDPEFRRAFEPRDPAQK